MSVIILMKIHGFVFKHVKKSVHFRWYGSHGSLMIIFGIGGLYGIVSVQFFLFLKIFIFSWFFITEFTGMSSKIIKIHQKPMIFGDDRSNNSKKKSWKNENFQKYKKLYANNFMKSLCAKKNRRTPVGTMRTNVHTFFSWILRIAWNNMYFSVFNMIYWVIQGFFF